MKTKGKVVRYLAIIMALLMLLSSCTGTGKSDANTEPLANVPDDTNDTDGGNTMIPGGDTVIPEISDKDLETVVDGADGSFYDGFVDPAVAQKWKFVQGSGIKKQTASDELYVRIPYEKDVNRHLARSFIPSSSFDIEFKMKIHIYGSAFVFYMYLGDRLLQVNFYENTIITRSNGQKYCYSTYLGNDWHTYKITVSEDTAHLFLDGEHVLTWALISGDYGGNTIRFVGQGNDNDDLYFLVDYMKYTPTSHVLSWDGITNGAVYTDVDSISLKTKYNRDLTYESNSIIYYANGAEIGTSSKSGALRWNNVKPGIYHIQAKSGSQCTPPIYITVKSTAEQKITAKGLLSSDKELLSSYILRYAVSGSESGRLTASDGFYSLQLDHSSGNVTCLTDNGSVSLEYGTGNYIVTVDGGVANLYYEGMLAYSFRMPRASSTDAKKAISSGSVTELKVEPFNQTFYSFAGATTKVLDKFGTDYAIEFTYTKGTDARIKLFDSEYFVDLMFKGNTISATAAPDDVAVVCELGTIPEGTNRYRFVVNGGIAILYVNNIWYSSVRLSESIAEEYVAISGSGIGDIIICSINDKYFANITFDNDQWKSFLTTGTQTATVTNGTLKLSETTTANAATLKVYSRDCVVGATVKFNSKSKGAFYLLARYTNEHYGLCAGYNYVTKQWEIISVDMDTSSMVAKKGDSEPTGTVNLRVVVEGDMVSLYVNGALMISGINKYVLSYGNVGFATDGSGVEILSLEYEGEGSVLKGSKTISFLNWKGGTPGIVELSEDKFLISSGSTNYFSNDALETYTTENTSRFDISAAGANMIKLQSGKILSIKRKRIGSYYKHQAYVYSADGRSYNGPFTIETDYVNHIAMNGRVKQMSSGRVIFVTGCFGAGGNDYTAFLDIWYSDDDGKTWIQTETDLTYKTFGVYLSEGTVVELDNGVIRLYGRTLDGFLYYTDSYDGGKTWETDLQISCFASVQSAFNVERDYSTGYIYLAWEYVNANEEGGNRVPRARVGLAVSMDNAKTWQYVCDIDEFSDDYATTYHWNLGVIVTTNYVLVTVDKLYPVNNKGYQIVRIDKEQILSLARFTALHSYTDHRTTPYVIDVILANSLIVTDEKEMYLSGEYSTVANYSGAETKVSIDGIAQLVYGTVNGSKITIGRQEYELGGTEITLAKAAEILGWTLAEGEGYTAMYYNTVEVDYDAVIAHTHFR